MKKSVRARRSPGGVWRVRSEPCRLYTEAEIHERLTRDPAGYVRFLRRALVAIATGRAQLVLPPKQVFADRATGGDFRVMPCELRAGRTVTKTVKLIGTNTVQRVVPDQITVGRLYVLHPREHFVCAAMEACLLSSARTGACAALAISALARARARLAVIGSGRVGLYAALYACAAAGARHVTFSDLLPARARAAARWLAAACPRARCEARPFAAIHEADVVVLATTSAAPLLRPPAWGANLVVSLGADCDAQSELDPSWAGVAELYCDSPDSLRFGDLRRWIEAGRIRPEAVTELWPLHRHQRPESGRPRVFVSTGSALFDNLTARYLLERRDSGPGITRRARR